IMGLQYIIELNDEQTDFLTNYIFWEHKNFDGNEFRRVNITTVNRFDKWKIVEQLQEQGVIGIYNTWERNFVLTKVGEMIYRKIVLKN
ncbi:MAG TPA: hypothetical protein VLA13_03970, partial [Massilibacterium sp.]|nr:hypothetical protein [Massilibacterium sp.]